MLITSTTSWQNLPPTPWAHSIYHMAQDIKRYITGCIYTQTTTLWTTSHNCISTLALKVLHSLLGTLHTHAVRPLLSQQFPYHHSVRPHVHFLRVSLMSDHLWRHPRHCPDESHLCTFVSDQSTYSKVCNLDSVVLTQQNTAVKM